MRKIVAALFLVSISLGAQSPLSVGVKGGGVKAGDASPPLTIGPYVEVRIPLLASIESGVLFKRYDYGSRTRSAYEIPILLKKRLGPFPVKPFLSAGATIFQADGLERKAGLTLGTGFTFPAPRFKVEPEIRYTRYPAGALPRERNQTEFLVGFRF